MDKVLQEVVQRERFETYHRSVYLGRVIAAFFGLNMNKLAQLEQLLDLAIFQTAFNPREIQRQMEAAHEAAQGAREARLRDARLLERTARYSDIDVRRSVEEEKLMESMYTQGATKGVSDPWTP